METQHEDKGPRVNEKKEQPQQKHDKQDSTWIESRSAELSPSTPPSTAPSAMAAADAHNTPRDAVAEGDLEQQVLLPEPVVIQGQTNLLPMKQLLIVFSGLSTAMLCSNLNQTMYVKTAAHFI